MSVGVLTRLPPQFMEEVVNNGDVCRSLSALSESVKACGAEALALLGHMKQRDSLAAADNGKLKAALEAILATAEVCASHQHYIDSVRLV